MRKCFSCYSPPPNGTTKCILALEKIDKIFKKWAFNLLAQSDEHVSYIYVL